MPLELSESKELTYYLLARIENVSNDLIDKDLPLEIHFERLIRFLTSSGSSGHNVSVKMSLRDHKHKTLSHAKTLRPNDPTGRSSILAIHRVHTVTREVETIAI